MYFHRFHKRAETSVYDHILQQLGSSREDNLQLCCLGTVANSLVGCVTSCTRMKVVHKMPALGPDLERSPPQSEQVTFSSYPEACVGVAPLRRSAACSPLCVTA